MLIAVTGTPGTGKSESCKVLRARGHEVLGVLELARERHAVCGSDCGEVVIDTDVLRDGLADVRGSDVRLIIEGHLSHHLAPDTCIVLRCSPSILEKRLSKRRYPKKKMRDNVEAEAIDLVLIEALDSCKRTFEVDTTDKKPEEVADDIEKILAGKTVRFKPGKVDWSQEVLAWY